MATVPSEVVVRVHPWVGMPVLVQFRCPILIPQVTEAQALPHAIDQSRQWIPTESREEDGAASVSEFIRYAVVKSVLSKEIEIEWLVPSASGPVTVRSIFSIDDIVAITRIVTPPPLPEEPKLITL